MSRDGVGRYGHGIGTTTGRRAIGAGLAAGLVLAGANVARAAEPMPAPAQGSTGSLPPEPTSAAPTPSPSGGVPPAPAGAAPGSAQGAPEPPPAPTSGPPPVEFRSGPGSSAPPAPAPPSYYVEPAIEEPPPPPPPAPHSHSIGGLYATLGLAFGGDDLVTAELSDGRDVSLAAGRGVILNVGGRLTPLWVGESVGFGIGADIGWKYTSITASNGTLSLTRFPVVVSAHALIRTSGYWYLLAAGGLHHELGVQTSGDGIFTTDFNADFDSTVGGMGELGAFYGKKPAGGSVTLRYTSVRYELAGQRLDASNVGLFAAVHWNL